MSKDHTPHLHQDASPTSSINRAEACPCNTKTKKTCLVSPLTWDDLKFKTERGQYYELQHSHDLQIKRHMDELSMRVFSKLCESRESFYMKCLGHCCLNLDATVSIFMAVKGLCLEMIDHKMTKILRNVVVGIKKANECLI